LISETIILDIQNNYFRYQKLRRIGVSFNISEIVILDIKNNYLRYQKKIKKIISDIKNSYLYIRNGYF